MIGLFIALLGGFIKPIHWHPSQWTSLRAFFFPSQKTIPNPGTARAPAAELATPKPSILPEMPSEACQNIYRFVCQKPGETHDLTGGVRPDVEGEKQALRMYKEIIQNHRDWTVEQIDEELVQQIFEPKRRARIQSAFNWVRNSIEHFIDRQPVNVFTAQEKHQIKARLRKTELQLPPPASVYGDEPDLLTRNEAYYERTLDDHMRLRVGGAYVLVAKSWFNLINTLAHELAHSIDPCEIRVARLSFPAYDRLTACFLHNRIIATSKDRAECGQNDKLSEIFADWIAVQVIADALDLFATEFKGQEIVNAARNSVRDLCEQEDEMKELDFEFHPTPQIRIGWIFGRNPKIRQVLGCGPPEDHIPYCSFESDIPSKNVNLEKKPGGPRGT